MNLFLDNIIFSLQRAGGISIYWSELWSRFLRDSKPVMAIEAKDAEKNLFRSLIEIPKEQISIDSCPFQIGRYFRAPVQPSSESLFHACYYRRPSSRRIASVQTCHDFTYERYRNGPARWLHSWQKKLALTSANGVICVSENTRQDLLYYCPSIREENTCVIHHGFSEVFKRLPKERAMQLVIPFVSPETPFSVFVGDRSEYKNFRVGVDAVALCPGQRLVVVGGGPLSNHDHEYLERHLCRRWVHIDKAPSPLLNALYNRAHALIYPSNYEGFGIPVIEAMAAGCPVIALNASSIPDVAGDAGLLIDRADAAAVAEQLQRLEDEAFRDDVIARGMRNVQRFSWERCYQETLSFYSQVLGS